MSTPAPPAITAPLINRLGVLVLAAGKGVRMGGRPKCLLERDGEPLIARQLRILDALQPVAVVVVLGHYATEVAGVMAKMGVANTVTRVTQPSLDHSQPSSIRLGLQALSSDLDAVMVCPSDLPLLETADYQALLAAYLERPAGVGFVGPLVNNIPGNPVIFDRMVRRQIETRGGQFGCGNWRNNADASVWNWPSSNERYTTDVDTERDLLRLEQDAGVVLRWPGTR